MERLEDHAKYPLGESCSALCMKQNLPKLEDPENIGISSTIVAEPTDHILCRLLSALVHFLYIQTYQTN